MLCSTVHAQSETPRQVRSVFRACFVIVRCLTLGIPLVALPTPMNAQGRLVGRWTSAIAPMYEEWKFGGNGAEQPTADGAGTVRVRQATQWSFPLALAVPIGERWLVDLSGAYASGTVKLATQDSTLTTNEYTLSGLTDVRLRVVGRLAGPPTGNGVLVTLGLVAPTGKTELQAREVNALRVLAAPAFGFQVPTLGSGAGATAGVVGAREISGWALALAASYELRRGYEPGTVVSGVPLPELDPSDAVHLSLGADRLLAGRHAMTLALSADLFTEDHLRESESLGSATAPAQSEISTKPGPVYTLDWQLQLAPPPSFRELTFYAVDRYRAEYSRSGQTVSGSGGNYLDLGARSTLRAGQKMGVLLWLSARHQTGLDSDRALATASVRSGALTLGLVRDMGSGLSMQPFVRGQAGTLDTGDERTNLTGFSFGISLGRQW